MYSRYAERQGWAVEVLDATDSDLGGYKDVRLAISSGEAATAEDEAAGPLSIAGQDDDVLEAVYKDEKAFMVCMVSKPKVSCCCWCGSGREAAIAAAFWLL